MFPLASVAIPHVKSGRLRALGVTNAEPSALFPGLPAVRATLPGYEASSMTGMFASAHTPMALITRLNQEVVRVLNRADVKEKFFSAGVETVGSSPEELAAAMKSDMTRLGKVIKDAGIRDE
jgi:tripartite-type tricarboxylate transporter receptor subunit TctC